MMNDNDDDETENDGNDGNNGDDDENRDNDDSKVFEWKKGQSRPPERVMCGGTDFNAPTKWVNEKGGFDGLIICTDMEAPKPVSCKVQRMWITDEYNAQRPYFNPKPERMLEVPLK